MTEAEKIAKGLTEAQRRAVPGYEGKYEVSADGEVFSLARQFTRSSFRGEPYLVHVPGRRLAIAFSRKGYPQVTLYSNNQGKTLELHRVVCRAFHGEPPSGAEAAHRNGDKTDCRASNLRWATRSENALDKWGHGTMLHGDAHPRSPLSTEQVRAIFVRYNNGEGGRALAREFGVNERAIRKIGKRESWRGATADLEVRKVLEAANA